MDNDAINDFLAIDEGPVKECLRDLILGRRHLPALGEFGEGDDDPAVIEVLREARDGYNWVRVGDYMVAFKLLSDEDRNRLGRGRHRARPGLAESRVSYITRVAAHA